MLNALVKPAVARAIAPLGRGLLRVGLTPDIVTVIGTVASVTAAVLLFPSGHLVAGALVLGFFVTFDMLDGAMARERGGGTRFGAALDATCDRIADGAIFGALAWWTVAHLDGHRLLLGVTLVALVAAQVTSYAKARAEAGGLRADAGLIERPERLIIVLVGAGLTGLGVPQALHVAMWLLAVGGVITVVQRLLDARRAPGAGELLPPPGPAAVAPGAGRDARAGEPR